MMKAYPNIICEYIWIGGNGELRSKTRVIKKYNYEINDLTSIPDWNYDGSSTNQAPPDGNTEVILKPCALFKDPFRIIDKCNCILVLCDTYDNDGKPLPTNHRKFAVEIFNKIGIETECWFGLEQEYFIKFNNTELNPENIRSHYCGFSNKLEKTIVEEHLQCCIFIGLNISGINAEVASGQWEFQIGPSQGITAADELIVARYLIQRVAEKYNATIIYSPKLNNSSNGSGCHINFSTLKMRDPNGINEILLCMKKLEGNHNEHMAVYGEDNDLRLTGKHETSDINKFTWGFGTRNTSVRIPNITQKNSCGYFEDRRPAANIDPYQATSIIAKTCYL
jgi:glutamine synthetase